MSGASSHRSEVGEKVFVSAVVSSGLVQDNKRRFEAKFKSAGENKRTVRKNKLGKPMSELNSTNQWVWNCGKDFDYRVYWGNSGTLTLQRNLLRSIHYSMQCWNPIDGWFQTSAYQTLPVPTSQPHTFSSVAFARAFGSVPQFNNYWGQAYIISTTIIVISGESGSLDDEDVVTTVSGCFRGSDSNYYHLFPTCPYPPDVPCI